MLGIGFYSLSDDLFCNFGELKGVITQKIKKIVFLSKCVPKHVFSFYFILWGCSMPKYCKKNCEKCPNFRFQRYVRYTDIPQNRLKRPLFQILPYVTY